MCVGVVGVGPARETGTAEGDGPLLFVGRRRRAEWRGAVRRAEVARTSHLDQIPRSHLAWDLQHARKRTRAHAHNVRTPAHTHAGSG
jgi:hypothetical protein